MFEWILRRSQPRIDFRLPKTALSAFMISLQVFLIHTPHFSCALRNDDFVQDALDIANTDFSS